ncbi:MAG TPA: ABC transporter permease, partial [Oxalicibacterium sp.]|nr:ABC transporter permease [Oxalicibacterium sp.]
MFLQSLRMTRRDWRAGELRFLLLALIVAVAALSSVGFFVDRMRAGLERDAHKLLGADLVIRADEPVPSAFRDEAQRRGLRLTDTAVFASMATAGEGGQSVSRLASVKAVGDAYPLRGKVELAVRPMEKGLATDSIPQPGSVWVDAGILSSLHVSVGDALTLGNRRFAIAGVITKEPDRGAGFMNFAPRVMLADSDLASTGLIQYGSRVAYRLLVAGTPAQISAYEKWVKQTVSTAKLRGVRVESLESGQPEMRATLQRAQEFLSLVGLLSAMLAAVAVAMAARRFMLRHVDACAMLRCLGMTQNEVTLLYLIEFLLVGVLGSALGALLGFAAHFALIAWLGRLLATDLPAASLLPAAQAMLTGLLLLIGFAIPPILQLREVPHNRVIRREQEAPRAATIATYALGLLAFVALLLWQADDLKLALLTAAGFVGGMAGFALIGWLGLKSLGRLRGMFSHPSWRFAITALQRRPGAAVLQIVALALGLMALLMLTVIRGDLVDAWRKATPADAPNRFVINIQPEQKADIETRLKRIGVADVELFPMIRGRLLAINNVAVNGESYVD